jgi:hypothetical protein
VTSRDFCFWLQGFLELDGGEEAPPMNKGQVACVKRHLALVFKHEIDPSMGPAKQQADLDAIHNPFHNTIGPGPTMRC